MNAVPLTTTPQKVLLNVLVSSFLVTITREHVCESTVIVTLSNLTEHAEQAHGHDRIKGVAWGRVRSKPSIYVNE